jgi:hypothetical protein
MSKFDLINPNFMKKLLLFTLLVFNFLLLYKKYNFDIKNDLVFTAIICGLIAGTRFSAMIPIALFFFKPWLELVNRDKIRFVLIVAGIFLLAFLPFVFWDTKNWIFFSLSPFSNDGESRYIFISTLSATLYWGSAVPQYRNLRRFIHFMYGSGFRHI